MVNVPDEYCEGCTNKSHCEYNLRCHIEHEQKEEKRIRETFDNTAESKTDYHEPAKLNEDYDTYLNEDIILNYAARLNKERN